MAHLLNYNASEFLTGARMGGAGDPQSEGARWKQGASSPRPI